LTTCDPATNVHKVHRTALCSHQATGKFLLVHHTPGPPGRYIAGIL